MFTFEVDIHLIHASFVPIGHHKKEARENGLGQKHSGKWTVILFSQLET